MAPILVVLCFAATCVAAVACFSRSFSRARSSRLAPSPAVPPSAASLAPAPRPSAPVVRVVPLGAACRPAPIEVDLLTPRSCAVRGCRRSPSVPVALSSRTQLHLCPEHALALEFQKVRWGIRDPRAALRGLGRVEIARA